MRPTTRFMIEPSLVCPLRCRFCYHLHRADTWSETVKSLDAVKAEIDAGICRGNDYCDITGGEPCAYPHIVEAVEYALSKGIRSCIITSGIIGGARIERLIEAGLDEFLVSRHGLEGTHDDITRKPGAYRHQLEFLNQVQGRVGLRFNSVISRFNQSDLVQIAADLAEWEPSIVNFINMNPHHGWLNDPETANVIADLDIAGPLLNEAISLLEGKGIGVNVRYYPMCCLSEEYRRCVCNDLHVMLDSFEWDYATLPKTLDEYTAWGVRTSNNVENKDAPCDACSLGQICGGVNKAFHAASGGRYVTPQPFYGDPTDAFFYRRDAKTLVPR